MAIDQDPKPVAVAEILLSKEERLRIAKDLGLERDELDAVPEKLEILRFADKDLAEEDVSAFAIKQMEFGKVPGGILIPV
jgi:hypothetical protein